MPQNTDSRVELPVKLDDGLHRPICSHELWAALTPVASAVGTATGIEQPITAAAAISPRIPTAAPKEAMP